MWISYNLTTMIGKEEFWADAKNELSKIMQAISYEVWVEKLEPLCFVDDTFVLVALTQSAKRTIDDKYLKTIAEVVRSLNSAVSNVEIITPDKKEEYLNKQTDFIPGVGIVVDNRKKTAETKLKNPFVDRYTFDNFVMGKSNNSSSFTHCFNFNLRFQSDHLNPPKLFLPVAKLHQLVMMHQY